MADPLQFNPPIGISEEIAPGVSRLVAPNPSAMTFRGTNTYLVGSTNIAVIDPGPDMEEHLEAILRSVPQGSQITHILVTHAHVDHSPLARKLADCTGAPIYAYGDAKAGQSAIMQQLAREGLVGGGEGVDHDFVPDVTLKDGETIEGSDWTLTALWTPGHFGNHLSFAMDETVFCGDLVMNWSSSLVSPPDGDLSDFMTSCTHLLEYNAKRLLPGHGDIIFRPRDRLEWLIDHRRQREASILDTLATGPLTISELTRKIYVETPVKLLPAAERNVLAHLVDLYNKKQVLAEPQLAADATFSRL